MSGVAWSLPTPLLLPFSDATAAGVGAGLAGAGATEAPSVLVAGPSAGAAAESGGAASFFRAFFGFSGTNSILRTSSSISFPGWNVTTFFGPTYTDSLVR